jgi:hypothetical protein
VVGDVGWGGDVVIGEGMLWLGRGWDVVNQVWWLRVLLFLFLLIHSHTVELLV